MESRRWSLSFASLDSQWVAAIYPYCLPFLYPVIRHLISTSSSPTLPPPHYCFWSKQVLFYCHFPDKLLCSDRRSFLKRIYRWLLDWIEETTTGKYLLVAINLPLLPSFHHPSTYQSHPSSHIVSLKGLATVIAVNSRFTAQVFKEAFTRIGPKFDPAVIYPAINLESFVPPKAQPSDSSTIGRYNWIIKTHFLFLEMIVCLLSLFAHNYLPIIGPIVSLNRFERKKNIGLALEAFAIVRSALVQTRDTASLEKLKLFIAGK